MADDKKKRPSTRAPAKRTTRKKKVVEREASPSANVAAEPSQQDIQRLLAGEHPNPHAILGAHPVVQNGQSGVVVRAMTPSAQRAECLLEDGRVVQLARQA